MHNEALRKKWQKRKHLSNPSSHIFFANFLIESHYLDHPLFTHFFVKTFSFFFLDHFQHGIYFLINSFLFQTYQFFFFVNFQTPKNIFFWRKRIRHSFFLFFHLLFKVKHHPTSRKKQNEKLFLYLYFFFRNWKTFFSTFSDRKIITHVYLLY